MIIYDIVLATVANIILIHVWRNNVRRGGKEKFEKKKDKIILLYTTINVIYYFSFWIHLWELSEG